MPSRHAFLTFPQVILRHALHVDSGKGKAHIHISRGLSLLCPRPIIHISMFLKTLHTDVREELCLDVVFCRSVSLARLIITHLQKTTSKLALARAKLEYFLSIKENYCSANEGQRVIFCKSILFLFLQKLYIFLQTWPHPVTDHGYSVHIEPYDLLWLSLKEADISFPLIRILLQGSLCSWLSHWPQS